MNEWLKVILLGIVEGLTEFLPVSSTGHLLIAARLLDFRSDAGGTFEIFIQLGAILAVVGYYARDLLTQARAVTTDRGIQRFWLGVLLAFLPAAVLGVLLRKWIKTVLFASPSLIAWSLIVGGIVFIVVELWLRRAPRTTDLYHISWLQSLGIGMAQVFALVPGVSRSGASIVGGMLGGLDRATATRFSFYLAIPTLGAATLFDLASSFNQLTSSDLGRLLVGAVVSFVVAWVSIGWLLRYLAQHSLIAFGIYRLVAGAIILGLVALRIV